MNPKQLESLLIDQSLGELPEEVSALLNAYLARHPDQSAMVPRIRDALAATETVVTERPELFRVASGDSSAPILFPRFTASMGKWAAIIAALAMATGAGFFLGRQGTDASAGAVADQDAEASEMVPPETSPWARYQFRQDGQLAVVPAYKPQS